MARFQSLPTAKAVEPLRAALDDENASLRAVAATSLSRIPGEESTTARLEALNHPDVNVRRATIQGFHSRPSPLAVDPLCEMLKGEDKSLEIHIYNALGKIDVPESTAVLVAFWISSRFLRTRSVAFFD